MSGTNKRGRLLRLLMAMTAVPLAVIIASGTAAHAGKNNSAGSRGEGVRVFFYHDGEHFHVCDDQGDGLAVYVDYIYEDVSYQRYNSLGSGTCYDHNLSFIDGRTILFRVPRLSVVAAARW